MKVLIVLALVAAAVLQAEAANWAVCVAGSNGYYNYRHQSDTADCYQIFKMNGFPAENIITMLYDDVANDPSNPKKGQLFNWPGGPDVYAGIVKDYVGNDVSPTNFLNVLKGVDTGNGKKVIKSGPNDRIFVAFFDHGAPGIIAFPTGDMLHASDLNDALNWMSQNNKFKEMVLYIEACESGSMFNNILATNTKIYAVTAANPSESSWACDYDSTVQTYLNDCFSINWMLDTRGHDTGGYTLQQQYQTVMANTTQSHVCQYGDLSFQSEEIAAFMGKKSSARYVRKGRDASAVPSEEVVLKTLQNRMMSANGEEKKRLQAEYDSELMKQKRTKTIFDKLRVQFPSRRVISSDEDTCHTSDNMDLTCMKVAAESYRELCHEIDDYALYHFRHLAGFCRAGVDAMEIRKAMKSICA